MKLAIMQPYVFPYVGYFQLINAVDKFVFYDDVNFIKRGWVNRNTILINGKESLITFPCVKASQNREIKDIAIDINDKQYGKILKTISLAYKKAPYYEVVFPLIESCFLPTVNTISDLAIESIKLICQYLDIDCEFKKSSEAHFNSKNLEKADRLIKIAGEENCKEYINALGGQEIYNKEYFNEQGINLKFLNPVIESYEQFGNEFVPNLSILDVLMFNSIEETKNLLAKFELV